MILVLQQDARRQARSLLDHHTSQSLAGAIPWSKEAGKQAKLYSDRLQAFIDGRDPDQIVRKERRKNINTFASMLKSLGAQSN